LSLNGSTLHLKHPAHTDSDITVNFGEAGIIHVADTYWNGIYPFIDYSTGESIGGMIEATEANLATVTDDTIVIPGHGAPVSNVRTGNPYGKLPTGLMEQGIQIELCGATAAANHWGNADLLPGVKVDTNAMVRVTQLEQDGFTLIFE